MIKRALGKSGIEVSVLGFGAGHIGGNNLTEAEVSNLLNEVVDLGINLFDSARGYGLSEERIATHLSYRRSEIIISTKVGYGVTGVPDWTYKSVEEGIDEALRKLRTDYIDIVHLHSCSVDILKQEDVIKSLIRAMADGKIRVAAYSGENDALIYAANRNEFGSLQCSLNPFDQRNIVQVLPIVKENKIGMIAKRPLANVPWKFTHQPAGEYCEEYWKRMMKMNLQLDMDWLEAAIRFTAFTEGVNSIIIGTSCIEHLKKNIKLLEKGKLPAEIYTALRNSFIKNDENWISEV